MTQSQHPFPYPAPASLLSSDAAKWYLESVRRIPEVITLDQEPFDVLMEAWAIKCRLRLAAALALVDAELSGPFLDSMPLPSIDRLLERAGAPEALDAPRRAFEALLTITLEEKRSFPATIGESIGMEVWDGKRWLVMTEAGWQPQTERGVPKGFPVLTPDGFKPIDEIRAGDLVLSAPPSGDGPPEPKRVLRTFKYEMRTLRALGTAVEGEEQMTSVAATEEMDFWVEGLGWRPLEWLPGTAPLRTQRGTATVVYQYPVFRAGADGVGWVQQEREWQTSIGGLFDYANYDPIEQPQWSYLPPEVAESRERYLRVTVHDLDVEDFHTYYVSDHWVRCGHNETNKKESP